jgi:integrase
MRKALTEILVTRTKGPVEVFDLVVPGFGIRIGKDRRTYFLMYRGADQRQRRMTIGDATTMSLKDARARASERKERRREGSAPEPLTFGEATDRWMRQHVSQLSVKTHRERRAMLDHDAIPAWSRRIVDTIRKHEVVALVDGIVERGSPIQANRVFEMLRAFFNWCVSKDILTVSPCNGAKRPTIEVDRERFLDADEVRRFWHGCEATGGFRDLFRLMLVTAQRETEVGKMWWSEVDFGSRTWTIPAERAKNGKQHLVPLSDLAVEILTGRRHPTDGLIFPSIRPNKVNAGGKTAMSGFSRAKERLDAAMRCDKPFVLHDLRRTVATHTADIGVHPHVIEAVLNHRRTIRGVAATYNRYEYLDEKRDALQRWSERLRQIIDSDVR